MTSKFALLARAASTLSSLFFSAAVAAQPLPTPPASPHAIFSQGVAWLGRIFGNIGSLAGGGVSGEIWQVDIRSGQRRRIGNATDVAWAVPSVDGTAVYAIRGRQVICIAVTDGRETPVGAPAEWRKLVGVLPNGTVLGFVQDDLHPRRALIAPNGERIELPPADDAERKENAKLLQERSDYADRVQLDVRDSERGGRGRDVFLIDTTGRRNLTDCGDDICGQPSRSQDGHSVYYIHARKR